jgi:hypothetical protein
LDTEGNIFGGFTPLKWESREWNRKELNDDNRPKMDDNEKSFLFTLKNPHNFPAKRFKLKTKQKHRAIWCDSECGPCFGAGGGLFLVSDLHVCDNCNTTTKSSTFYFGCTYINDTKLESQTFFTGSAHFQVQEIEVFEITD